jgi:hypothetical protein
MQRKRARTNPKTREEWQAAVNAAAALRALADCKMYGIIDGGPRIDVERCDELLAKAEALDIRPNVPIETLVVDFVRAYNDKCESADVVLP